VCPEPLFEVENVLVDGKTPESALVAPGALFSLAFSWTASNPAQAGDGERQLVVGYDGQPEVCVGLGIVPACPASVSDLFLGELKAPGNEGAHELFAAVVADNDCLEPAPVDPESSLYAALGAVVVGSNQPPALADVTVDENPTGNVQLQLSLLDDDSDLCTLAVDLRVSPDGEYEPASLKGSANPAPGLAAAPGGETHTLTWQSLPDLGKDVQTQVYLRLVAADSFASGEPFEVGPLMVSNGPFGLVDETEARLPVLDGDSRSAALGDYDEDGDPDLALAVGFSENLLLTNDGGGYLEAQELPGGKYETNGLAAAHIDDDQHLDLFVGNVNEPSFVLLGDGKGGFTDHTDELLGTFPYQVEKVLAGDLDGDGDDDFLVLCSGSQPERLLLNDKGELVDVTATHLPADTLMAASGSLGSVDSQGPPDLAFACFISSQTTRLWVNDGTGHFTDQSVKLVPVYESMGFDALFADLDSDGFDDLFEANLMNVQRVLINNQAGMFSQLPGALPDDLGPMGDGIAMAADASAGDLDLDGCTDVFLACSGNTPGYSREILLLGSCNGALDEFAPAPFPAEGGDSRHGVLADLDGDGDVEILVVNALSQTRLYINK